MQSCLHVRGNKTCIPVQDPSASYDFVDEDHDPIARHRELQWHGTSCAGIVSAAKDNDKCGVGIAHNSNMAG